MSNIKSEKGKVTYCMRTGAVFVRSHMPLAFAKSIINRGKNVEEVDKRGCGIEICVDDKYFFPIEEKPKATKKADPEPKTEENENE